MPITTPRLRRLLPPAACLLLALIFVGTGAGAVAAQAPAKSAPLDPQAYATWLNHSAAATTALRQNPAGIARFRRSLPAELDVRSEGQTFRISTGWLDSALAQIQAHPAAQTPKWREIQERLDFLREQVQAFASPVAAPSTATATGKLDAIFRRREFRGMAGPGPLALWWQRLTGRIGQAIAWLLARLHLGKLSGNLLAYGLIAVALIFLLLWSWRALAGRTRDAKKMPAEDHPPQADGGIWASQAQEAAERGQFREAIRCAYWAAVSRLEEQGVFASSRSCTPREMLRLIAPGTKARHPFRELTQTFELVWYGYRSPSPADWENTKMQMERIGCLGTSSPPTASS